MKKKLLALLGIILLLAQCNDKPDISIDGSRSLVVYPNPVQDQASVFVNADQPSKLVVFGQKAEVLLEKDGITGTQIIDVNLTNEPEGTYHAVLESGGETIVQKFLKIKE